MVWGLHGYGCAPKTLIHCLSAVGLQHRVLWQKLRRTQGRLFCCLQSPNGRMQRTRSSTLLRGLWWQDWVQQAQVARWEIPVRCRKTFLSWMSSGAGGCPEHLGHLHLGNVQNLDMALGTGSSWMYFTCWGRLETSRVTKMTLSRVMNPREDSNPRKWMAFFLWLVPPSTVWIRVDVDISEADGNHRWVRNEQLTAWHRACYGAGPWGGGWMGWEVESCCDLKQTLIPKRAQDFTSHLSSLVLVLFASLITSGSWRMLHFLAYFEHCSLSPSPRAGLQLPSCTPTSCSVSQFYEHPISRATWAFHTHLWACQDLSAASPILLPISAAPRLLLLLDVPQCTETSELGMEGRHDLNQSYFFNKFRAFYTKNRSFLRAGWMDATSVSCFVVLKMFPGKQYCRQNGKGFQWRLEHLFGVSVLLICSQSEEIIHG